MILLIFSANENISSQAKNLMQLFDKTCLPLIRLFSKESATLFSNLQKFKCIFLISGFAFCEHIQSLKLFGQDLKRAKKTHRGFNILFRCHYSLLYFSVWRNFCNKNTLSDEESGCRTEERKIELLMPKSKVVRFKFCSTFNITTSGNKNSADFLSYLSYLCSFFLQFAFYCAVFFHAQHCSTVVNSPVFCLSSLEFAGD